MHANIGHPGSECPSLGLAGMWRDVERCGEIRRRSAGELTVDCNTHDHSRNVRDAWSAWSRLAARRAREDWLTCSAGKVSIVPFVLEAVVLEQIGVGQELFDDAEANRLREGLRIRDRDRQIEMTVVAAAEALLDAHVLAVARAARVEPAAIVEARGVDDQRVAFPAADRVALPYRRRICRKLPSIREDLTERRLHFVQHDDDAGRVDDLEGLGQQITVRDT